jgi:hypothetical protein
MQGATRVSRLGGEWSAVVSVAALAADRREDGLLHRIA